jgi:cyclase
MKRFLILLALTVSINAFGHGGPARPEPLDLDSLMSAFGWDLNSTDITTQKLDNGLAVLFGVGGNIGVSTGEDGVFIVDDQFPVLMPKIKQAIGKLGGKGVDFAVTTHWHFDHAEGNLVLGPEGTWLVAHENSREMMKEDMSSI